MNYNNPVHLVRSAAILVIALSALMIVGCSGVEYGAAQIDSKPSGADIINLKDDTNLGKTPAKVVWKGEPESSEKVTIQLRKNGYHSAITSFWVNKRHKSEDEARANAIDVHAELVKE